MIDGEFATFAGPHLPDDQMRAYAQQFEVYDEEIDDFRPAKPTDHFPMSQLENAPDLSLMAKKRAGFHGPYGTGLAQLFKGMGGAGFPAGTKWKLVRKEPGPRLMTVNADEGEPGSFKDRFYLDSDPHASSRAR